MAKTTVKVERAGQGRWQRTTLPRVILIVGAESALREEALAAVKAAAFGDSDPGMSWNVKYGPTGSGSGGESAVLTPADVMDDVCTGNMFADPDDLKVVVVRQADQFLSTKDPREIFERALETVPDSAVLVLEAATYGTLKTTRLYKALAAANAVVECEPLIGKYGDSPELAAEVDRRAIARGLKLGHGALMALVGRSAKNLGVIESELDKLALELQAQPGTAVEVSEEQIAELCAATGTYNSFAFADAVLERDARRALEIIGGLFERGISDEKKPGRVVTNESSITMLVLGALTYKLTQLQDGCALIEGGMNEFNVFGQLKLFGQRQEAFKRLLKKHSALSARRCMEALFRAYLDVRLSGMTPPEVLETMVWRMVRA